MPRTVPSVVSRSKFADGCHAWDLSQPLAAGGDGLVDSAALLFRICGRLSCCVSWEIWDLAPRPVEQVCPRPADNRPVPYRRPLVDGSASLGGTYCCFCWYNLPRAD